jgi:hypothetical protein
VDVCVVQNWARNANTPGIFATFPPHPQFHSHLSGVFLAFFQELGKLMTHSRMYEDWYLKQQDLCNDEFNPEWEVFGLRTRALEGSFANPERIFTKDVSRLGP